MYYGNRAETSYSNNYIIYINITKLTIIRI